MFIILTVILTTFITTLYIGIACNIDYLSIFHPVKEVSRNGRLTTDKAIPFDNMRIQAFAFINNYQFDSVILGTSILENTSSQACNVEIGGTFMNLSIFGSSFYERSIVLNYLLKNARVNNIIYSLDLDYISHLENNPSNKIEDWDFIYEQQTAKRYKKFFYYMNKKSMLTLLGYNSLDARTPDRPCAWMRYSHFMLPFGGLDNWIKNQDHPMLAGIKSFLNTALPDAASLALQHGKETPATNAEQLQKTIKYIDDTIFNYVKANKKTKFYFVFPPYWRFIYARWRQATPPLFALHQDVVRYVVAQAQALGNVEIYGFEDCDFVDEIKNYRDPIHYHPHINEYMTQSIGAGVHRLTPDNVEAYLSRCESLAKAFNFQSLAADVKTRLEAFRNKKTECVNLREASAD